MIFKLKLLLQDCLIYVIKKKKKRHGDNQPWLKIGKINLSEKHKEILISETGWLDDSIVIAAQYMLQMHYSIPGLQNTLLGYSLTYEIMRKEFIQILHNGDNHWVTVSTVGLESSHISLYDSLHSPLSNFTKDQICALLNTDKPFITVQFSNVERQCNSFDCGIYAIAFATSLCCGEDVSSIKYNNKEMRKHLLNWVRSPHFQACKEAKETLWEKKQFQYTATVE